MQQRGTYTPTIQHPVILACCIIFLLFGGPFASNGYPALHPFIDFYWMGFVCALFILLWLIRYSPSFIKACLKFNEDKNGDQSEPIIWFPIGLFGVAVVGFFISLWFEAMNGYFDTESESCWELPVLGIARPGYKDYNPSALIVASWFEKHQNYRINVPRWVRDSVRRGDKLGVCTKPGAFNSAWITKVTYLPMPAISKHHSMPSYVAKPLPQSARTGRHTPDESHPIRQQN